MSRATDIAAAKIMLPMTMERLPDLVGFVANGGSLIDFCNEHKMEYSKAIVWLYDTNYPDRKSAYEGALSARSEYVVQAILRELKAIAMIDIRQAFNQDGTLKTLDDMPPEITRVISSIEVNETFEYENDQKVWTGYTKKVKLTDKLRALELLGKNLLLFVERKIVTGNVTHTHKVEDVDLEDRIKQLKDRRNKAIEVTAVIPAVQSAEKVIVAAPEDF